MILYHYAQAVRDAVQDTGFRCLIVNEILADELGYGVSLHSLAQGNTALSVALNASLKQSITANSVYPKGTEADMEQLLADPSWDANGYLQSKLVYEGDAYEPVVHFVKPPALCQTEGPISVIVGESINECDEAIGWRDGVLTIFSEEGIMASNEINIFVGPGDIPENIASLSEGSKPIDLTKEDELSLRSIIDIDTDRYQIKAGHRYENDNRSEVKGWRLYFLPSTPLPVNPNFNFWQDFDPLKIHKDDINASKIFYPDEDAFTMSQSDFNSGLWVFAGAWESDWLQSAKLIFNNCSEWGNHSVQVKMKYSNEWYFFDCGVMSTWFPNVGSHKVFENSKCMFDLVRKQ